MIELFANSGDPDQTPRSSASDLGQHCLPVTLLGVSRLQWVKLIYLLRTLIRLLYIHWQRPRKEVSCLSLLRVDTIL